jgi:signal peptidase II
MSRSPGRPLLLALGVGAIDLGTKAWAIVTLAPRTAEDSGGSLDLALVHNPGVAFGIGASRPGLATATAAAGVLAVALWLVRAREKWLRVGLALALGGGGGNLADRLWHGWVTDWIHVTGYPPTFNLADVAVRAGALVVLASLLLPGLSGRASARSRSRPATPRPAATG